MARVRVQVPIDRLPPSQPETSVEPIVNQHGTKQLLNRTNVLVAAIAVLALCLIIILFFLLHDRNQLKQQVSKLSTTQNSNPQADVLKYQTAVSKLVDVPTSVTPQVTVLTSDSINQLPKGSVLQTSAKVGDAVLLYKVNATNSFVVIYRPSNDKVIIATASTSTSNTTTKP